MADEKLLDDLARVAHRCWCEEMLREGWRHGETYNAVARTHDALVPYDRLSRHDKRWAALWIDSEEMVAWLAKTANYPRGPDRPLTIEEMRIGLRVRAQTTKPSPDGSVVAWTTDAEGELEMVTVQWPGGWRSEYCYSGCELVRVGEESSGNLRQDH